MKKIGVVGWNVGANSFGVTHSYLNFLSHFGKLEILTPSHERREDLDLLVLPGGQDLMSSKYGRVPSFSNSNPDVFKEFFYENNLELYINAGVPVFGICLGHQMLQVFFGGELNQNCAHPYSDERNELVHELTFFDKFKNLKFELKLKKEFKVNSMHHQGIDLDELADVFEPICIGPHNIVEAMKHKTLSIASVQFHPKLLWGLAA